LTLGTVACGGAEEVIVAGGIQGVISRRSGQDCEWGVGVAGVIVLLGHVRNVVVARVEIEHCPKRRKPKKKELKD